MMAPARFDDLTPGAEHSFVLEDQIGEVVAHHLDEVGPLLDEIERRAGDGLWAAGFIAYEAAPAFDAALRVRARNGNLPLAWFGLYRTRRSIESPRPSSGPIGYSISEWRAETTPAEHAAGVGRIRAEIERGITYQVNHTFRLRGVVTGDLDGFHRDLLLAQRAGYGAWIDTGRFIVASASPELFFRLTGREVEMRPMKGTAPRGRWPEEDVARAAALRVSEKERAENLMIVDLLRNDLGKVAEYATVTTPEMLATERYETVWQLTSTVRATLRPEITLRDLFAATFPSGSVTGAPKASTMGLIADLETSARGVYCGAIGHVAPGGDARFNVAIRTAVIDTETGAAEYGTGGGITWDSTPEGEYDEAILKTAVLTHRDPPFALIETMRLEDGEYLFEERHLHRLAASAAFFGFSFSESAVASALRRRAAMTSEAAMVRLTLEPSGKTRLETIEEGLAPFVDGPREADHPVTTTVTTTPIDRNQRMVYHKTTERRIYEAARRNTSADDVLLINEAGEVTESTVANVAVLFGSEWITPPIESGCLPGVYRSVLLDRGVIAERPILATDLARADDLCLINSVRGWRRAVLA